MTAATSKMELFVIIVNGFQPLTVITECFIMDVVAVLDPLLYALRNILSQHGSKESSCICQKNDK